MPTLATATLSASGKSIVISPNDLADANIVGVGNVVDWGRITISIAHIALVVQELNDSDGINVHMATGIKYTLKPSIFTSVGGNSDIGTSAKLNDAFMALAGL